MNTEWKPSEQKTDVMSSRKLADATKQMVKRFHTLSLPLMTTVALKIIEWEDVIDLWEGPEAI